MRKLLFVSCLAAGAAFAAQPAATATVTVAPAQALGAIKPMHGVNNGPVVKKPGGDQVRGNFEDYKAARIPLARTHDSINCVSGGAHTCDINAIFPNFDADENDPKNYDFVFTDHYLDNIRRAGTHIFFRLGQTIEHGPKKYGVLPPKDFGKWARICEHVIRHATTTKAGAGDSTRNTRPRTSPGPISSTSCIGKSGTSPTSTRPTTRTPCPAIRAAGAAPRPTSSASSRRPPST